MFPRTALMYRVIIALLIFHCSFISRADGVSPYLPLNMSPEAERQIERLLALSGAPILTRPIPAVVVHEAIKDYCQQSSLLCRQVKLYLKRYAQSDGFTYANLELSVTSDKSTPQANRRGQNSDNVATVNGQLYLRVSPHWYAFLGGERREDGESLEGTYTSVGWDWMQLDFGYRPHWFSPSRSSSMTMSTQAETPFSITVSNPVSFDTLGFRYQLFATRLSESDKILSQNSLVTGKPCLVGMHLSINPVSALSLGANRLMMYGGGSRGECHKPDNIVKAFFDPGAADNSSATNGLSKDDEFGNQIASLTSRLNVSTAIPFNIYFEFAGEDTTQFSSHRLGNTAMQAGLFFPALGDDIDMTVEYSEWNNAWYVNGIYGDGATSSGNVLGHYMGDLRAKGDAVAGSSIYIGLGYQLAMNQLVRLEVTTVDFASYSSVDYVTGYDFKASYAFGFEEHLVSLDLQSGKTPLGDNYSRAGVSFRW